MSCPFCIPRRQASNEAKHIITLTLKYRLALTTNTNKLFKYLKAPFYICKTTLDSFLARENVRLRKTFFARFHPPPSNIKTDMINSFWLPVYLQYWFLCGLLLPPQYHTPFCPFLHMWHPYNHITAILRLVTSRQGFYPSYSSLCVIFIIAYRHVISVVSLTKQLVVLLYKREMPQIKVDLAISLGRYQSWIQPLHWAGNKSKRWLSTGKYRPPVDLQYYKNMWILDLTNSQLQFLAYGNTEHTEFYFYTF